jgi:hypothetical protein
MAKKILIVGQGSATLMCALMRMEQVQVIKSVINQLPAVIEWPAAKPTCKPVKDWQAKRRTPWRKRK